MTAGGAISSIFSVFVIMGNSVIRNEMISQTEKDIRDIIDLCSKIRK